MRYTLLELVQDALGAMESDEVNSISDTVESYQLAVLIKGVFYDIATDLGLPEHEGFFELNASGDNAKPTLMTVPTNVLNFDSVKYDNKLDSETNANYQDVSFMPFGRFLDMQNGLRERDSGVGEMVITNNSESFPIMYASDRMPVYYTTMDDYTLVFDSYDSTIDTTLAKAKTMAHGSTYPTFTLTDNFAPDLDPTQFSYFRNKIKLRAFSEMKQVVNQEAAAETRRQKITTQRRARTVPDIPEVYKVARFGRTPGGYSNRIPKNLKNGS